MPEDFEEQFYEAALQVVLTTDIRMTRATQPRLLNRIEQLAAVIDRYREQQQRLSTGVVREARGIRVR